MPDSQPLELRNGQIMREGESMQHATRSLTITEEVVRNRQGTFLGRFAWRNEPFNGYSTTGVSPLLESSRLGRQPVLPPAGRLLAWLKVVIFPNPGNQIVRQISMDGEILFE